MLCLVSFRLAISARQGIPGAYLAYSRPFLRDGVLQYKKKWSQRIVGSYTDGFALKVLSPAAAKPVLCHNPFIFKRRGVFYGAVFVDAAEPLSDEQIQEIHNDYFHVGLGRLFIYCLAQDDPRMPNGVSAELSNDVEFVLRRQPGRAITAGNWQTYALGPSRISMLCCHGERNPHDAILHAVDRLGLPDRGRG